MDEQTPAPAQTANLNFDQRFTAMEQKLDAVYKSSEKMRKFFKWTLIITLIVTVLPLLGLLIAIPQFLSSLDIYKQLQGM